MARTQYFDLIHGNTAYALASFPISAQIPQVRNFDQLILVHWVTAVVGTGTLDLDVETEADGSGKFAGGSTDTGTAATSRLWARIQTKGMGIITNAQGGGSAVYTVGTFALGTFTQVTQATVFDSVEMRGLDALLGKTMRVTARATGVTSWTFNVGAILKASSVG